MSLILNETPMSRLGLGAGERPGVAVTYVTTRGDVRRHGTLAFGLNYRMRYEIDMSDHRDEVVWSLPSRDERRFNAAIRVGWRVHDPCVVTQRRVADGFDVIKGYLQPVVRRLSRERSIEELHQLEDQINQLVIASPARFAEGLEVFHVNAELSEDEQTVSHAASLRDLDREVAVADRKHAVDLTTTRSQIDIDAVRRKAIERMVAGENGLLLHHLTVHREDTMGVLQVLQQQDQLSAQARARLLEQFQDRLLPEELDSLAELLIQQTKESIERPSSPQIGGTHVPPAIVPGSAAPVPTGLPPAAPSAGPLRSAPDDENDAYESRRQLPPDHGVKW